MNDRISTPLEDETTGMAPDGPGEPTSAPPEHSSEFMVAGIRPDEPMAEAVRKIMYRQYQDMLANEAGCRGGKSIDAVHDMRVATRRLRVAFRLFGSYYRRGVVRELEQELRRTGRTLGAARDLDVFNKTARQYLRTLPKQQRSDLDPLLGSWKRQRQTAHRELVDYFDSPRYRRFVEKLDDFLTTAGAGVVGTKQPVAARVEVRHVLASTLWERYETVRAYEVVLPAAAPEILHALRIECKYMRYTLEFFQEVLGTGVSPLIRQVIALQDHLGEIQDGEVASRLLAEYLSKAFKEQVTASTAQAPDLDGITRYLSYRREQSRQMTATFPQAWKQIDSVKFRRRLAAVIVTL